MKDALKKRIQATVTLEGVGEHGSYTLPIQGWIADGRLIQYIGYHYPQTKTAYIVYRDNDDVEYTTQAFIEHDNGYGFHLVFVRPNGSILTTKESTYKYGWNGGIAGLKKYADDGVRFA